MFYNEFFTYLKKTIKFPILIVAWEKMGLLLGFCALNNWKEFLYDSNYSGWGGTQHTN